MQFGVIFDMDGVIVDSNPFHKRSLQVFVRQHGLELPEEDLKEKIYGRPNRAWIPLIFGEHLSPEEIRNLAEEKEKLFREMFAAAVAPLAGLKDFLAELRRENVPRAIATSAPKSNVDFTLEATGIAKDDFPVILDDRHFDRGKPDPQIYLKAAEAISVPPGRCFVFEDSLSGIESALRAGATAIGVTTTHSPEELEGTILTIGDFREIRLADLKQLAERF